LSVIGVIIAIRLLVIIIIIIIIIIIKCYTISKINSTIAMS